MPGSPELGPINETSGFKFKDFAIKKYNSIRGRVDPESLALAGLVGFFAIPLEPPIIEAATAGLKYLRESIDPDIPRVLAAGVTVTLNAASIAREHRTLKEQGKSISTNALITDTLTGNHAFSTTAGHLLGIGQSATLALGASELTNVLAPITGTGIIGEGRDHSVDFMMATLIVTASSRTAMNTLILHGATQPLIDFLKPKREFIQNKARNAVGFTTKMLPKKNHSSYIE
ncbi:MAG TPA: hypothetical protein VG917_04810 [Patescibacteria group bacterium]|nr:hypothetical protein [Patescibacteria group bacterium]